MAVPINGSSDPQDNEFWKFVGAERRLTLESAVMVGSAAAFGYLIAADQNVVIQVIEGAMAAGSVVVAEKATRITDESRAESRWRLRGFGARYDGWVAGLAVTGIAQTVRNVVDTLDVITDGTFGLEDIKSAGITAAFALGTMVVAKWEEQSTIAGLGQRL